MSFLSNRRERGSERDGPAGGDRKTGLLGRGEAGQRAQQLNAWGSRRGRAGSRQGPGQMLREGPLCQRPRVTWLSVPAQHLNLHFNQISPFSKACVGALGDMSVGRGHCTGETVGTGPGRPTPWRQRGMEQPHAGDGTGLAVVFLRAPSGKTQGF